MSTRTKITTTALPAGVELVGPELLLAGGGFWEDDGGWADDTDPGDFGPYEPEPSEPEWEWPEFTWPEITWPEDPMPTFLDEPQPVPLPFIEDDSGVYDPGIEA